MLLSIIMCVCCCVNVGARVGSWDGFVNLGAGVEYWDSFVNVGAIVGALDSSSGVAICYTL